MTYLLRDKCVRKLARVLSAFFLIFIFSGCNANESFRTIEPQQVASSTSAYNGKKHRIVLGKFENRSPYQNGIFSDGVDRLGAQSRQILKTHLSQSNRFVIVDRMNMDEMSREAKISGKRQMLTGADLVVTGAVTEFGRKETGFKNLGGLIGKSKTQIAYGKVSISIVDVSTSEIVSSYQGAGEYQLKNKEVLGWGSTAGYDSTLADKVLNLAMIEVVNHMVSGLERGEWQP